VSLHAAGDLPPPTPSFFSPACRTRQTRGNAACAGPRVPVDQLEDAILTSFQATYRDQGLFEAGLQAALAEAATERPTIEAELAGTQKQYRETTAALDRYLQPSKPEPCRPHCAPNASTT
jgi:hypothetical protein